MDTVTAKSVVRACASLEAGGVPLTDREREQRAEALAYLEREATRPRTPVEQHGFGDEDAIFGHGP